MKGLFIKTGAHYHSQVFSHDSHVTMSSHACALQAAFLFQVGMTFEALKASMALTVTCKVPMGLLPVLSRRLTLL